MRGVVIRAGVAAGLLVVAFAVAVVALNQTVFTASGFVRGYLDALQRQDAIAALALAGPAGASSSIDDLLVTQGMSALDSFEVSESELRDGAYRVDVEYVAEGMSGRTAFEVVQRDTLFGLFPTWGFARSPLAEIDLTVRHAREFTANGVRHIAPAADQQRTYLAFTPGVLTFEHMSQLLEAPPRTVVLGPPDLPEVVDLEARANAAFVGLVQAQVDEYLDECAAQQVLFPPGCPFGQEIADRIVTPPRWEIVSYPAIALQPTSTLGEWSAPQTGGVARITVDVQSIYDGTVAPLQTEVPYSIGFVVTFVGENEVVITPRLG